MQVSLKYEYGRYGDSPGVGGVATCSNHHVLPYYVIKFFGLLCAALAKKKKDDDMYNYLAKLHSLTNAAAADAFIRIIRTEPRGGSNLLYHLPRGAIFQNYVAKIAWIGYNLFTGPAAIYRTSDPGQGLEPVRPASLPMDRWAKINQLWKAIQGLNLPHTSGTTAATRPVDYRQAASSARSFLNDFSNMAPWQTRVSDWLAEVDDDTSKKTYRIVVMTDNDAYDKDPLAFKQCHLKPRDGDTTGTWDKDHYLRIIKITGGAKGKAFCSLKSGAPEEAQLNRPFVDVFGV